MILNRLLIYSTVLLQFSHTDWADRKTRVHIAAGKTLAIFMAKVNDINDEFILFRAKDIKAGRTKISFDYFKSKP